jgi:Somatomedin B domain
VPQRVVAPGCRPGAPPRSEAGYEASFWSTGTTFNQGCQGIVQAAIALGFSADEIAAIDTSWEDVGIDCEGGGDSGGDSCGGRCGEFDPAATCQCDEACTQFGDCCGDFEQLCTGDPADPNSCLDNHACGGQARAAASATRFCSQFGDCCADDPCRSEDRDPR